jgi:hypothetical protein
LQQNRILHPKTAEAIDSRVEKILKDLGHPKPPLSLADVRTLLKLDLGYYSSDDDSWLKEKIHQMKVAGKQVLEQPTLILNVVKSLGLKGVLLAEKRRILLDKEVPKPKHRWNEAHEITHDLLPWHDGIAHGDPETTLSPACHEQVESEANYGAGRLLFLGGSFEEVLRSSPCEFKLVEALHAQYGNTLTTTLWRVVELSIDPCVGLVTCHPRKASGVDADDIKYFIRSSAFMTEFAAVTAASLFNVVKGKCFGRRGPLGDGEFPLSNARGESVDFCFETFFNGHDALTLVRRKPSRKLIVGR